MKVFMKLFTGMFLVFILTGCIGEDYDVGVPTAHLHVESFTPSVQLTEANINWGASSEDVHQTIEDIQKFGLSQDEIKIFANEQATVEFEENEENGGDIWTDPETQILVALLKDKQRTKLKINDFSEFLFPTNKGRYVLVVEFISEKGSAQYVGNVLIQ
ncbi:hypothetical protein [Lysinibacillus parviboronicapiens]|uniref:hypothetical protein n=1 Tax=Lysinibacillus parviboronicapiens TaxID=436516 RepID=UPI001EE7564D|nr:hypothetical protein [Lysinibacillus parviboronicapiens]